MALTKTKTQEEVERFEANARRGMAAGIASAHEAARKAVPVRTSSTPTSGSARLAELEEERAFLLAAIKAQTPEARLQEVDSEIAAKHELDALTARGRQRAEELWQTAVQSAMTARTDSAVSRTTSHLCGLLSELDDRDPWRGPLDKQIIGLSTVIRAVRGRWFGSAAPIEVDPRWKALARLASGKVRHAVEARAILADAEGLTPTAIVFG